MPYTNVLFTYSSRSTTNAVGFVSAVLCPTLTHLLVVFDWL